MAEEQIPESSYERKVTWSLMAIIIVFVLLMTCIVLWITSSLIRNEMGKSNQVVPSSATALLITATPVTPTVTPTALQTATPATPGPLLVNATWTPVFGEDRYVKFVYWYVRPNKISVGECARLTWETENAVKLQLYRDDEMLLEEAPPSGTLEDCPGLTGYAVYRLVAENRFGESNWIQLQVKVQNAP